MSRPTPSESTLRSGYRGLRFSAHAIERMDEMRIRADEVVEAVLHAALSYPSLKYPGMLIAVRDKLAIPYTPEGVVATVLWNGAEGRDADLTVGK